jgi:hypothetical protein
LQAVDREVILWACGMTDTEMIFIGYLIIQGIYRVQYNIFQGEMGDWLGTEDSRSWDNVLSGVCCTWCMQHLIYAVQGVKS